MFMPILLHFGERHHKLFSESTNNFLSFNDEIKGKKLYSHYELNIHAYRLSSSSTISLFAFSLFMFLCFISDMQRKNPSMRRNIHKSWSTGNLFFCATCNIFILSRNGEKLKDIWSGKSSQNALRDLFWKKFLWNQKEKLCHLKLWNLHG